MPLLSQWDLPEVIRNRLGDRPGRQRTMVAEGHLLLVLHRVPQPGQDRREGVMFWRNPEGQWQTTARRQGLPGLRSHVESYELAVDEMEQQYRDARSATDYFHLLKAIAPLQRAIHNLHPALQAAREAVPGDRDLIVLRDQAYDLARSADLLHSDTQHGLNHTIALQTESQARSAQQLARTSHHLNALAAIFLPLMAVGALFGMNLRHGLEEQPALLFWVVFLGGLMIGVGLYAAVLALGHGGSGAGAGRRHATGEWSRGADNAVEAMPAGVEQERAT